MRSYIVLISPSYGGAERRFFDIFWSLRDDGLDVVMIAPSSLVQRLIADHQDLPNLATAFIAVELPRWSRMGFIGRWFRLLRTLPPGSRFHYPMSCLWPLHWGRADRISMSVTECSEVPGPFACNRNGKWTWFSFFFVERIDVLSPGILSGMATYRAFRKMSLTPGGTFVATLQNSAVSKTPTVVLLSRLVAKKGIDDLLDVLPQVWAVLSGRVPKGFSLQIAGYGPLEDHVVSRVAALFDSGVPIAFLGYADPSALLSRVAVVLSMQEVTNYPSRVVAEALTSGCAVVVRNSGDSMQFGSDLPGLVYCRQILEPQELAQQISQLLNDVCGDPQYSRKISELAIRKFSSKACINYFYDILSREAMAEGKRGSGS